MQFQYRNIINTDLMFSWIENFIFAHSVLTIQPNSQERETNYTNFKPEMHNTHCILLYSNIWGKICSHFSSQYHTFLRQFV